MSVGVIRRWKWLLPAVTLCAPLSVAPTSAGNAPDKPFTELERSFWAFQPVSRPEPPSDIVDQWVRSPIDAFVLRALQAKDLEPSGSADKVTLIRRVSLGLLGLPPSPAQVQRFVRDTSPGSYERLVDRLLASPHYGEKWGRHWLDLARFAESDGFERDESRPNAWRYRDYVVDALNADRPYDRFVKEQIAGDELWPESFDARIATAFNRNYAEEGNQKDLLLARQETLDDITTVVGSTFLGLTVGCAKCHDHKFDPIPQRDYYRLQAVFANVNHDDRFPIVQAETLLEYERSLAAWEEKTSAIWKEMASLLGPHAAFTPEQLLHRYPDYVIQAIKSPPEERTAIEAWMASLLASKDCGTCPIRPKPFLDPLFRRNIRKLKGDDKARFEELETQLKALDHLKPADVARGTGIVDVSADAPPTHVLGRGQLSNPLEEVGPGFPSILDAGPVLVTPALDGRSTGRRSALAKWLVDPSNPLTARVMVNRIWQHHFGRGIVRTPGDFGAMGDRPTHPDLLDWLADEFMASGWSIKRLQRQILLSNTYRQSAAPETTDSPVSRAGAQQVSGSEVDPSNRLLWRYPRQRHDAEVLRDSALSVAGLLNPRIGGPSVFPPLPTGMPKPPGGWTESDPATNHRRRSLYIFVRRNSPYPMLDSFDFPDTHESCAMRSSTTTAPQALALLNGDESAEWARAFARRILDEGGTSLAHQVETAYLLVYSRAPLPEEKNVAFGFLDRQATLLEPLLAGDAPAPLPAAVPEGVPEAHAAALVDYSLMLLNSNEFAYRF